MYAINKNNDVQQHFLNEININYKKWGKILISRHFRDLETKVEFYSFSQQYDLIY